MERGDDVTKQRVNSVDEVDGGVVRKEEGVVGGVLEDLAGGEGGEDEPGHQLGIGYNTVTAHQVHVQVDLGQAPAHGI